HGCAAFELPPGLGLAIAGPTSTVSETATNNARTQADLMRPPPIRIGSAPPSIVALGREPGKDLELAFAASCLGALTGNRYVEAAQALRDMTERRLGGAGAEGYDRRNPTNNVTPTPWLLRDLKSPQFAKTPCLKAASATPIRVSEKEAKERR